MQRSSLWNVTKQAAREATLDFFEPLINLLAKIRSRIHR
jgi:hypothetical protein